jgi:hypothetical protein
MKKCTVNIIWYDSLFHSVENGPDENRGWIVADTISFWEHEQGADQGIENGLSCRVGR